MTKIWTRLPVAVAAAAALYASPAMAQATRTWVSGVGDDANPCSRTAPCKTFAGAISKTAPNGEINVLDPGGFGAVTITKSITISAIGFEGGVLVSGTNGIIINAGTADRVVLIGLDIEGLGTGLNGVRILAARDVLIQNCNIHGFLDATNGAGVMIDAAGKTRVTIDESTLNGNRNGVRIQSADGQSSAKISRSLFTANSVASVSVTIAGNNASVSDNQFYGSPKALDLTTGGTAQSFGNNTFGTTATDAPTTITPLG